MLSSDAWERGCRAIIIGGPTISTLGKLDRSSRYVRLDFLNPTSYINL